MLNKDLIDLLADPKRFKINTLPARAAKLTSTLNDEPLYLNLNGEYQFQFFEDIMNRDEYFYKSDELKTTINLPSNIERYGYGQLQYANTQYPWEGIEVVSYGETPIISNYCGQYLKFFDCKLESDYKYILNFEGVESSFNVWLNEEYIGYFEDSYTTAEFDITKFIKAKENRLAIEVYKFNGNSFLDDQDFWRLSGIFRSVKLIKQSSNSITDFSIDYELDYNHKSADVICTFNKEKNTKVTLDIHYQSKLISTLTTYDEVLYFKLENLDLWSAEIPNLYAFTFSTQSEKFTKMIGFRTIEIVNKLMLLNGKRLSIRGINRHEFDSVNLRAITNEQIENHVKLLKENNFNAIRTSHYPNNNYFYEVCDKYGIYVMDEANIETHGTWFNNPDAASNSAILPDDNSLFREAVLSRILNMYERDKNNTCVLFWSLANESFGGQIFADAYKLLKQKNPHRIVHYEGGAWDKRNFEMSDITSRMYYSSEQIQDLLKIHNDKPIILCEFSHAMGNSNGNMNDYLELEENYPQYQGGFIWEFQDQAIYANNRYNYGGDFGDAPNDYNFICDGLLGAHQVVSDELIYLKNLYSPIKIKENDDSLIITNTNLFKAYDNLTVKIFKSDIKIEQLLSEKLISLDVEEKYVLTKILTPGNYIIRIYNGVSLLKIYSYKQAFTIEFNEVKSQTRFVDSNNNVGIHGQRFSVLFSKLTNNLSSIKYDNVELFSNLDGVFTPNFYRAPTNNDQGSQHRHDLRLANLYQLSYFSYSQIESYCYENNSLKVVINYYNYQYPNFKATLTYHINSSGRIDLELHSTDLDQVFEFGIKAKLNSTFTRVSYFGKGPIDTYIDRDTDVISSHFNYDIVQNSGYLFPQEYGNKSGVNYIKISNSANQGFKVQLDNYNFSLNQFSDQQLQLANNINDLRPEVPFLKINKLKTGVGGDDSWEKWVKTKNIASVSSEQLFKISIYPI